VAKRTHLLDHDPRKLISFLRCGWFKGHQIDDRDERRGRVSRHHHNISGVALDLKTTTHLNEVDCSRCLKAVEHDEHPALDNPTPVWNFEQRMVEAARSGRDPEVYRPTPTLTPNLYTLDYAANSTTTYTTGTSMATADTYWGRWVTIDYMDATTTANDTVWESWTTTGGTAATTLTVDALWQTWWTEREQRQMQEPAAIDNAGRQVNQRGAGRQYTQAEHDEYEREREAWRRGNEERRQQRIEAERIAEELLVAHLPAELAEEWQSNQQLIIEGQSGTRYGIKRGRVHNIVELDDEGKVVNNLCCLPKAVDGDHLPDGDILLGQILHLKHNEDEFRRVANITRPYGDDLWTPRVVAAGRQDEEAVA
jgi:hypothetical protein